MAVQPPHAHSLGGNKSPCATPAAEPVETVVGSLPNIKGYQGTT